MELWIVKIAQMNSTAVSLFLICTIVNFIYNLDFYKYFISVQDCKEDEFKCKDMTCIPNHKYCDNISDCPDSSDEMSCPTTTVSQNSKIKISKQFNFWDSSSPKKVNYKFIKIVYLFVYF